MTIQVHDNETTGLLKMVEAPAPPYRPKISRSGWKSRFVPITAVFLMVWMAYKLTLLLSAFDSNIGPQDGDDGKMLDFTDIEPSEKLVWHPCFAHPFLCARLTVPMDYHRPLNESGDNPKVHIALAMLPGNHSRPNEKSISPLLLNPGGPGGSGVSMVLGWGSRIHKIIGEDQDVIGFDPRGIGATTPRADCWASDSGVDGVRRGFLNRIMWALQGIEIGLVNSSSDALKKIDRRSRAIAKLCEEQDSRKGKDSILKYVHTPSVARDMISIIDAWDEWTESLGEESGIVKAPEFSQTSEAGVPTSLGTKGKLVYWGFSYGTLLGATFASMFPDRVGRVILDGVVDADLYVAPVWLESVRDSDSIVSTIYSYCLKAGEHCALFRTGDKEKDIEARFQSVLANLKENPLTIIDNEISSPRFLHYEEIKSLLFMALYSPVQAFPLVTSVIDDLYRGNEDGIRRAFPAPSLAPQVCGPASPIWAYPGDAQAAIMCSDKRYPLNASVEALEGIFNKFSKASSFADVWMTVMMSCNQWAIEAVDPPMRWDDHPAHKVKPINTSFPLLFISNRADPVTPLIAGLKMAKKFEGAGLIEQESEGHCSISAVSKCTIDKVRAYYREGKVPPPPVPGKKGRELSDGKWERCEADEWPWHPYQGSEYVAAKGADAMEDANRLTAWKEMQDATKDWNFWGRPENPGVLEALYMEGL